MKGEKYYSKNVSIHSKNETWNEIFDYYDTSRDGNLPKKRKQKVDNSVNVLVLILSITPLYIFRLGAHYRTSGSVGTEQEISVAKIIQHEKYNRPLTDSNDIALLQLAKPANLGVGIGLVCMPDISHPLPFDNLLKKCWITGWGRLSSGGSSPNSLMEARVPLVSKGRCDNAYPGKIDNTMLCAGLDEGGVDTCQGDSGGPLVCEFNSTWHLEGVTSWGYGCAYARKYGVYSYVRNLKAWVLEKIYQVAPPNPPSQNQTMSALGKD